MGEHKGQYLIGFDELFDLHNWRQIRNCPGRWVLAGGPVKLTPQQVCESPATSSKHDSATAKDPVLVTRLAGGCGLISYARPDGSFIHTLNDAEGFARKLADLGIAPPLGPEET